MDSKFPPPTQPAQPSPSPAPAWPRAPRSLSAGRGAEWWSEGWRVFVAAPWLWIGIVVAMFVIMLLVNLVPLLGSLAQPLLWPIFAGGLLLGCHALARGRPLEFGHLFEGFKQRRAAPLAILGLVSIAFGFTLLVLGSLVMFGTMGASGLAAMMSGDAGRMMDGMMGGPGGEMSGAMAVAMANAGIAALIALPILIVAVALFLMAWWFAAPLVVLNGARPIEALKASFDAAWRNLGALAVFGLIYIALAIVASIPFGLGWLILAPVTIGASYASWREVFAE